MWMGWLFVPAFAAPAPVKVIFVQEWPVADSFWIPWILGISKGFYRDEGIDLNVVAPPTVADTMKFLGTGRADVAFTTVMDIIFAKEQGAPVISIGRYGTGNNWGIFTPGGQPVTLARLKGKRIGIYNDAWTKAQLSLMLKSAGMTLDDIQIVAAAADTVPLLLQKRVDAATGITNAEGTEIVMAGKQTPEFIPAICHGVPDTPIFMFAGNQRWLEKNPQLAKAFMRATARSLRYAIEHPDEATAAFAAKYSKSYDENFVKRQWHDTMQVLGTPGDDQLKQNDKAWRDVLDATTSLGIVKIVLPVYEYYTNAYLP
ncbi:ABC transporter substrate-binding protein [Sodalis-like endosymbiont of Proechinophthirus fluctus]|nr:ABC transporter substrate-binding protein [Sodalis-like endosymbiont of Proechinophthirus fluctus]